MGNILTTLQGYLSSSNQIRHALPDIQHQTAKPTYESDNEYESCTEDEFYHTVNMKSFNNNTTYKSTVCEQSVKKYNLKLSYNSSKTRRSHARLSCDSTLAEPSVQEPSVLEDFESSVSSREDVDDAEDIAENMVTANMNNNGVNNAGKEDQTAAETFYEMANGDGMKEAANGSLAWEINIINTDVSKKRKKSPPKHLKEVLKKRKSSKKYKVPSQTSVSITNEEIAERKVFDLRRWHCMSRPQYAKSCGITSVVSVWNYLFSNIGNGTHIPITQEHALSILGFEEPFGEIRFGPFTGNATLMRWFRRLNDHFGVKGRAYYMYKPKGNIRTQFMTNEAALKHLRNGLQDEKMAYIYHCYNHYFCPIGYEDAPTASVDAYKRRSEIVTDFEERQNPDELPTRQPFETWILIGENSRRQPTIHCKKWEDITMDLNMESPEYYNIRHPEKGIMKRKTKKKGRNLHCIIAFKKL